MPALGEAMQRPARFYLVIAAAAVLVTAGTAFAQTPDLASPQGPLVLRPIAAAIVFSPEVKVTTFDDQTSTVIGGYAGKLMENRLLIGGGLYWLADTGDETGMVYGGVLLGWRVYGSDRFNASVRGLLGFGDATLIATFAPGYYPGHGPGRGGPVRYWVHDDFFVAEPEANVQVALTRTVYVNFGAGYRVTAGAGVFDQDLRSVTGTVGVQFNFGN